MFEEKELQGLSQVQKEKDYVRSNKSFSYYKGKGMEVIDVIQAFELGYNLGSVVKYILRAGKKGKRYKKVEDLKKAQWYLNIEIQREEKYYEAEKAL